MKGCEMHYMTLVETIRMPESEGVVLERLDPFSGVLLDYALVGGGWEQGAGLAGNVFTGSEMPKAIVPHYFLNAEGEMMVNGVDWSREDAPSFEDYVDFDSWRLAVLEFERECREEFKARYRLKPNRYYTVVDCHN